MGNPVKYDAPSLEDMVSDQEPVVEPTDESVEPTDEGNVE
jgi:hypothetical protein